MLPARADTRELKLNTGRDSGNGEKYTNLWSAPQFRGRTAASRPPGGAQIKATERLRP